MIVKSLNLTKNRGHKKKPSKKKYVYLGIEGICRGRGSRKFRQTFPDYSFRI